MNIVELTEQLGRVAPFSDPKSVISSYGCIALDPSGAAASNGTFAAMVSFTPDLGLTGTVGVPVSVVSSLAQLASSRPRADVVYSDEQLVVTDRQFRTAFKLESEFERFPETQVPLKRTAWRDVDEEFWDAFAEAAARADKETGHPVLSCVCVRPDCLVACDSFQAVRLQCAFPADEQFLLLPSRPLISLRPSRVQFLDERSVCFEQDDLRVWYRMPTTEYFSLDGQFEVEDGVEIHFPRGFVDFLVDVVALAGYSNTLKVADVVRVHVTPKNITAQWIEGDRANAEQVFRSRNTENVKFAVSATRLLSAVQHSDTGFLFDRRLVLVGDTRVEAVALVDG